MPGIVARICGPQLRVNGLTTRINTDNVNPNSPDSHLEIYIVTSIGNIPMVSIGTRKMAGHITR